MFSPLGHNKLHATLPCHSDCPPPCRSVRQEEVMLSRLRIGHTCATHSHLFWGEPLRLSLVPRMFYYCTCFNYFSWHPEYLAAIFCSWLFVSLFRSIQPTDSIKQHFSQRRILKFLIDTTNLHICDQALHFHPSIKKRISMYCTMPVILHRHSAWHLCSHFSLQKWAKAMAVTIF